MNCFECGAVNPAGNRFCANCGARLVMSCAACGAPLSADTSYCGACGAPQHQRDAPRPAEPAPAPGPGNQALSREGAERRQLTVLFCDMVGSTALTTWLDLEELREVMRQFQDSCATAVVRFGGHIAQTLGDGLMVYFGFPEAHEDDAQRAVRAGLDILSSIETLNASLLAKASPGVSVRLAVHTGSVVVGEVGEWDTRAGMAVVGEVPAIAARLQEIAKPGSLLISEATRHLVGGSFDCEDLGYTEIKGVADRLRFYNVRGESAAESRFDAAHISYITPLVGRESELGLLVDRWQQAREGEGQVVLLCGEAGIGKSHVVDTLRRQLKDDDSTRLRFQCSAYYTNSPFYPICRHLERAARFDSDDATKTRLEKLEALLSEATDDLSEQMPLIAALLSVPSTTRYPILNLTPQRQKDRTVQALAEQLFGLARRRPVLVIFEDAHWSDPSTLEWLDLVINNAERVRLLLVVTFRPDFRALWTGQSHVTFLSLNRLNRRYSTEIVSRLTGQTELPSAVLEQIVTKSDGVPLFIEELTKAVLESGLLRKVDDHYETVEPLPPLAIPATLQDSLMARLDRLAPVRDVAQNAAVIGREFSYELLSQVTPMDDSELRSALRQLEKAELIHRWGVPPESTYTFKHALVQEVAYTSLLRSKRHMLHRQIAELLESRAADPARVPPELLAHHFTAAGWPERAIPYWRQAGERAIARSANVEAVAHLRRGIDVLAAQPESKKQRREELQFQIVLGVSLITTKGYASDETGQAYRRAYELCGELGNPPALFQAMFGLWGYHWMRSDLETARQLAGKMLDHAKGQADAVTRVLAHRVLGSTLFNLGEFTEAQAHLEKSIALQETGGRSRALASRFAVDPRIAALLILAWVLWELGYPDQAMARVNEALTDAAATNHPYSQAFSLFVASVLHLVRGDLDQSRKLADASISISEEQKFPFYSAFSRVVSGWSQAKQGRVLDGLAAIEAGIAEAEATGASMFQPLGLSVLAEGYALADRKEQALSVVSNGLAVVSQTGERLWAAELHRQEGVLRQSSKPSDSDAAQACLETALEVARAQQAKSMELRAAISLARLWQSQGKKSDAHELLASVYQWFTEGFDTVDLKGAEALLEELK